MVSWGVGVYSCLIDDHLALFLLMFSFWKHDFNVTAYGIRNKLKAEKKQMTLKMTSSIIYFYHKQLTQTELYFPWDIIPASVVLLPNKSRFWVWCTLKSHLDATMQKKKKRANYSADSAEQCGILVWTQISAVSLLSCHRQPGWEGEAFCLRPAGSGLAEVFWSPASPSDVRAGLSHQCAFTGRFHVPFNGETAGLAGRHKQQAN